MREDARAVWEGLHSLALVNRAILGSKTGRPSLLPAPTSIRVHRCSSVAHNLRVWKARKSLTMTESFLGCQSIFSVYRMGFAKQRNTL